MGSVFRRAKRTAAALAVAMMLFGHAAVALADDGTEPLDPPLIQMIMIWLQGRWSVPGG